MRISQFLTFSLVGAAVIDSSNSALSLRKRLTPGDAVQTGIESRNLRYHLTAREEQFSGAPPPTKNSPPPAAPAKPRTSPNPQPPKKQPPPTKPPGKKCKRTDPACSSGTGGTGPPQPPAPGPAQAAPAPANGFKAAEGHTFLAIDVLNSGVMLSNGKYELWRASSKVVEGTLTSAQQQYKKIGTSTLTICSSVFLVGKTGTIGVHLQPTVCELFLKSSRKKLTDAQKKALILEQDLSKEDYKAWKDAIANMQSNVKSLVKKYEKSIGAYKMHIVMGTEQDKDTWGRLMAKDLLGMNADNAIVWSQDKDFVPAGTRLVMADYHANPPVFHFGGRTFAI